MSDQNKYEIEIKYRQIDLVDQHAPTILVGSFAVAIALAVVFRSHISSPLLITWLALFAAITVIRICITMLYRRSSRDGDSINKWEFLFALFSSFTGVLWGGASVLFYVPEHPELVLFIACMYAGLVAGATASIAIHMPTYIGFLVPATIPFMLINILEGGTVYFTIGITVLVFLSASILFARRLNQSMSELYRLQSENADLVADLQTEKESADESLAIAEKAVYEKNLFLAAASHDLRQPLHALGLLLGALREEIETKQGATLLDKVFQSTEALNQLFNSLLDVSRLDAGVVEVHKQSIHMRTILDVIESEYRMQAEKKNLSLNLNSGAVAAYTDEVLLERVLGNLVANAIAYTEKGSVSVEILQHSKEKLRIEVSDTGIGIPEIESELVFSEYYQLSNPERDRSKGLGLGLAIVRRLCVLLDVSINLRSSVSSGTTFTLYVQSSDSLSTEAERPSSKIVNLDGIVALVIDDDVNVLEGMSKLLLSWGCIVMTADSEEMAIEEISRSANIPSIIFADYRLREHKTGVDAIRRVYEELNNEIPAVVITGDTSPDRLREANASGFRLLHKPVTPSDLRLALQQEINLNLN